MRTVPEREAIGQTSPVATLVCFHAHPDDESIATGGLMARAAAEGHRVVLVVATRGEAGEADDGFLTMPEDVFARSFGTEWFTQRGAPAGDGDLAPWFAGLS